MVVRRVGQVMGRAADVGGFDVLSLRKIAPILSSSFCSRIQVDYPWVFGDHSQA
jgi:hypothetical protein